MGKFEILGQDDGTLIGPVGVWDQVIEWWPDDYESQVIADGAIAYWPMQEGTGTSVGDEISPAADGTISGASWVSGQRTWALDFNGSTHYVSFGNDVKLTGLVYDWLSDYETEVAADSPQGYWKLDEGTGTAVDSGSVGVDFSPTWQTYYGPTPDMMCATAGTIPDNSAWSATSFSVEMFVNLPTGWAGGPIFDKYGGTSGTREWQLWYDATNGLGLYLYNTSGATWRSGYDSTALTLERWYHVVATYDAGTDTFTIYVDGSARSVSKFTGAGTRQGDTTATVAIRNSARVSQIAYYNTVLSSTRVAAHWADASRVFEDEDLTVEVLLNWDDAGIGSTFQAVAGRTSNSDGARGDALGRQWDMYLTATRKLGFSIMSTSGAAGAWRNIESAVDDLTAGWHHVVARYDATGNEMSLWIDGVEVATNTTAVSGVRNWYTGVDTRAATLDDTSPPGLFDGKMSDLAVYRSALTDTQIANHATAAGL